MSPNPLWTTALLLSLAAVSAKADTFGTGGNTFTIDFATVGNAGNANDAGAGGGIYSSPYGGVSYNYRMSLFEISHDAIVYMEINGGPSVPSGIFLGARAATPVNWYQAAVFVNWLNTSTGHQPAYQVDSGATALTLWSSAQAWQLDGENLFRHKDAYYFLPNEDEWYKAAYHKNDGVTANYWDFATGSNTAPTSVISGTAPGTAVFYAGLGNPSPNSPAFVDQAGGLSAYGTMAQTGNVTEWIEGAFDGVNDSPSERRAVRGGSWTTGAGSLGSNLRSQVMPDNPAAIEGIGFRIASIAVPEPSSALLMLGSGWMFALRRPRWRANGA
jgi:hypothetical protein